MKRMSLLALSLALACSPVVASATAAQEMQTVMQNAPSIVTVKIVMTTQMGEGSSVQNQESSTSAPGVVVEPNGLIMLSKSSYSMDSLASMFGEDTSGFKVKTTPTSFKVTVGNESHEYSAVLAATDDILGLAFVQITDLGTRKLQTADFSPVVTPVVGDAVLSVTRLAKGYDFAPVVHRGRIAGSITLPRSAFILDGVQGIPGLPVYTGDGKVLGVITYLKPTISGADGSPGMLQALTALFSGGGLSALMQSFVVPNTTVRPVIAQAEQRAITILAKPTSAATAPQASGSKAAPKSSTK